MSNKKEAISESSSLSTFTHSAEHSEATKKAISTQQISMDTIPSEFQRQSSHYHIVLPFEIQIKSLIKHLRFKLEQNDINILYSDENAGQILVQRKPERSTLSCILDCFCIFRKQGWPKGSMFQTCEAASITIKRQYIDQKCLLGVRANYSRAKGSKYLNNFAEDLLQEVKKILQSYKGIQQGYELVDINPESPLAMEMTANKKIYELFSKQVQDNRFKTLYETSVKKLIDQVEFMEKQQSNMKLRVSDIIDKIIKEADSLFNFIMFSQNKVIENSHPQYILYAIQNMLCYQFFGRVFELYRKQMAQNCQQFRKNSEYINKNITDKQYFDYLEVRPKFRMLKSENPYDLGIQALRGLQTSLTLRQVLLCVQRTFSLIKVCCLYEHSGKLQLSSMDDVLPVMIYVVAKAQVQNFPVFVKIIDDYVRIRGVFELQERVTTTLYVATEDITKKLPTVAEK